VIYAAIDVNMLTHEKALAAGPEAMGLWTWGMCYAQQHATDGRLPRIAVLSAWGGRRNIMLATRLVRAALWLEDPDGSWVIFNYSKKNQRADDIERKRQASRDRYNRWKLQRSGSEQTRLQRVVDPDANAFATNAQTRDKRTTTTRSDHDQEQDQDQDHEQGCGEPPSKTPALPPSEPVTEVRRKRKTPETPCPASDATDDDVAAWAGRCGLDLRHAEFARFLDWHRAKGAKRSDWAASWRNWLRNAQDFASQRRIPAGAVVQSAVGRAWKMPEGIE
jgi:hypothetical protein